MAETDPRLASDFCGMHFATPLVLLSGCVGFGEEYTRVQGFSNRDAGAVCLKGTTGQARLGNPPHRVYETPDGMLNAIGLQNPGVDTVVDELPEVVEAPYEDVSYESKESDTLWKRGQRQTLRMRRGWRKAFGQSPPSRDVRMRALGRYHLSYEAPTRFEALAALFVEADRHIAARTRSLFDGVISGYGLVDGGGDAPDVLGRGPAAPAHEVHEAARGELPQEAARRLGLLVVLAEALDAEALREAHAREPFAPPRQRGLRVLLAQEQARARAEQREQAAQRRAMEAQAIARGAQELGRQNVFKPTKGGVKTALAVPTRRTGTEAVSRKRQSGEPNVYSLEPFRNTPEIKDRATRAQRGMVRAFRSAAVALALLLILCGRYLSLDPPPPVAGPAAMVINPGGGPVLLAGELPGVAVVVSADRFEAGRHALERVEPRPEIFVLDDGFSHLKLGRDLDVLTCPATDPYGGGIHVRGGLVSDPTGGILNNIIALQTAGSAIYCDGIGACEGVCTNRLTSRHHCGSCGNDLADHSVITSFKARRNHPLTEEQKLLNQEFSRLRIVVENTICQLKHFKVLAHQFRHAVDLYDDAFRAVVAIVNPRIKRRVALALAA